MDRAFGPRGTDVKELQVPNQMKLFADFGRWMLLATVMVLLPSQQAGAVAAARASGSATGSLHAERADVSEEFLAAIRANEALGADVKAQVAERYESLLKAGAAPAEAVTECLQLAYPAYRAAMTALESDDLATAWSGLEPLLASPDRYLAVDAAFFLGRSYLLAGQHERAIEPLQQLMAEPGSAAALRGGEALYYLGTAQAGALQIEPAMEHLIRFLQIESAAPDRLKQGAYNQLLRLEQARKTPLADAELRMAFSERRLGQALPDGDTQAEQAKVVDILNQLIEDAEKKESSGSSKNNKNKDDKKPGDGDPKPGEKPGQDQKPQQGDGQSSGQSSQSNGSATRQAFDNGPLSIWSQLRDRERDPANSAVKEQLPPEYRKLIERYFREMSEGSQVP